MKKKVNTGVTLEQDVLTYLDQLGKREDRDRSWLINAIVREHAVRHGAVQARSFSKATVEKRK